MTDWNVWLDAPEQEADSRAGPVVRRWPGQVALLRWLVSSGRHDEATTSWGVDPDLVAVDAVGEDALAFLQAQFCNDLLAVSAGSARPNGYCSPKGRLLALFLAYPLSDGIRMLLPSDLVDDFVKRLRMFVLRARVAIEARADLAVIGEIAPMANASGASDDTEASAGDRVSWSVDASGPIHRLDAPSEGGYEGLRRLHVGPVDAIRARWASYGDRIAGVEAWSAADIVGGRPRLSQAIRERFVPQMLNLEQIGALSFRKGCYPGQEIVARMQYLGRLKRHMRRYRLASAMSLPPGTDIVLAGDASDAGSVVSAVSVDDTTELLAVVRIDVADRPLSIGDLSLEPRPLPYIPPSSAARQQPEATTP